MNVYILTGSDDGFLGCYGSKKKALEAAANYIRLYNPEVVIEVEDCNHCILVDGVDSRTSVDITCTTVIR